MIPAESLVQTKRSLTSKSVFLNKPAASAWAANSHVTPACSLNSEINGVTINKRDCFMWYKNIFCCEVSKIL